MPSRNPGKTEAPSQSNPVADVDAVVRDGSKAAWMALMSQLGLPGATPPVGGPWAQRVAPPAGPPPVDVRAETRDMMLNDMARLGLPGTEDNDNYQEPVYAPPPPTPGERGADFASRMSTALSQMPKNVISQAQAARREAVTRALGVIRPEHLTLALQALGLNHLMPLAVAQLNTAAGVNAQAADSYRTPGGAGEAGEAGETPAQEPDEDEDDR